MSKPRIIIEGVGGIGGVVAAKLIQAGYAPALVTNNPSITEAIMAHGLQIREPEDEFTTSAQAYTLIEEVPRDEPFDAAYLIMKADAVVDSATRTVPLLTPEGYVVTFQNGIVEDAVAEAIGTRQVLSGIIGWGGTMHAPGVYERTNADPTTHVGELDGRMSHRVKALADDLGHVTPVVLTDNIRGALWSKLAINCVITTIGALTGQTLGEMTQVRAIRKVFLQTYTEVIDTAEAHGITLERISADPKFLYLPSDAGWFTRTKKDIFVRITGRKYHSVKSSMLQSLERGRKAEIEYLNGYVVQQAKGVGVATPVNSALVEMVREIESGERVIERSNIDELLKRIS